MINLTPHFHPLSHALFCPVLPPAKQHCPLMCPEAYSPVCGSDGETYENFCVLEEERRCENITTITMISEGECPQGGVYW